MSSIAVIQHEPNEGAGHISEWAKSRGIELKIWSVWESTSFELAANFEGVIVLGGEANVKDRHLIGWMKRELEWLRDAIDLGLPCYGVCLGAQIIATLLGAKVHRLPTIEIGLVPLTLDALGINKSAVVDWHEESRLDPTSLIDPKFKADVEPQSQSQSERGARAASIPVLQAHSYRFDIPDNCVNYASSELCTEQLFISTDNRYLGIQAHLEWSKAKFNELFPEHFHSDECEAELQPSLYLMNYLLDRIFIIPTR